MKKTLIIVSLMVILTAGCQMFDVKPDGRRVLTPQASERIDAGVDTVEYLSEAAMAAGMFWPGLSAIGALGLGIAGTVRKMKPKVDEAKSNAELAGQAMTEVVKAIEKYKLNSPDGWAKLKSELMDLTSPMTKKIIYENKT